MSSCRGPEGSGSVLAFDLLALTRHTPQSRQVFSLPRRSKIGARSLCTARAFPQGRIQYLSLSNRLACRICIRGKLLPRPGSEEHARVLLRCRPSGRRGRRGCCRRRAICRWRRRRWRGLRHRSRRSRCSRIGDSRSPLHPGKRADDNDCSNCYPNRPERRLPPRNRRWAQIGLLIRVIAHGVPPLANETNTSEADLFQSAARQGKQGAALKGIKGDCEEILIDWRVVARSCSRSFRLHRNRERPRSSISAKFAPCWRLSFPTRRLRARATLHR
ncbi:hypothetical protein EV286_103510 [Rhizobium sp. BK251]|nr:hypothetical protein EV286_103510 [Rhizobium sp. BK251]